MNYIYIAGPMSGKSEWNYPAFHHAARMAIARGWGVLNPADHDLEFARTHADDPDRIRAHYFRMDLPMLAKADAIAMLPDWQKSQGATAEYIVAQVLGLPVYDAETMEPYAETPLQEASRLVHGDRGEAYGHPLDDFGRTGALWGALLGIEDLPAETVALMMVLLKASRSMNAVKRDSVVDIAGYAETLWMAHEERIRRKTA